MELRRCALGELLLFELETTLGAIAVVAFAHAQHNDANFAHRIVSNAGVRAHPGDSGSPAPSTSTISSPCVRTPTTRASTSASPTCASSTRRMPTTRSTSRSRSPRMTSRTLRVVGARLRIHRHHAHRRCHRAHRHRCSWHPGFSNGRGRLQPRHHAGNRAPTVGTGRPTLSTTASMSWSTSR